ncbi:MAG: hypothetical protein EBV86_01945 [Marivivens sp.]|nr:hypothetical protein [Marivivens sp.]NCW67318.1 hypothetical protein [Marivivens sp.]
MKQVSFADVVNTCNLKEEQLEVPEWGGFIVVREMTAEARDAYEHSLFSQNEQGSFDKNLSNARAKLIAACVVGPDGKRMFDTEQKITVLGNQPISTINPIFDKCQEINSMGADEIEEIAGN